MDPFVIPTQEMKYASAMGNSECNYISWKIMELVDEGRLNARYTFLHLPKSMNVSKITNILSECISVIMEEK